MSGRFNRGATHIYLSFGFVHNTAYTNYWGTMKVVVLECVAVHLLILLGWGQCWLTRSYRISADLENSLGDCPSDFIQYGPVSCYLVVEGRDDQTNYDGAEEYCQSQGSTLASIETEDEMQFLADRFELKGKYHFVSAMRQPDGEFYWNTGEHLERNDDKFGIPDGWSDNYDCVSLMERNYRGDLYCLSCHYAKPFVCERSVNFYEGLDHCSSFPCTNGASCYAASNNFRCECAPGYTGRLCETEINECDSNPCMNGGRCLDGILSYTCQCGEQYTGQHCESGPYNWCEEGFIFYREKLRCFLISHTETSKMAAEFFCEDRGATLATLETEAEIQFLSDHAYDGRHYHLGGHKNEGDDFYVWNTGQEIPHDSSLWYSRMWHPNRPSPGEACLVYLTGYYDTGVLNVVCGNERGAICETGASYPTEVDDCALTPCANGGTCSLSGGGCHCPVGFTGRYCETDIDECASAPCFNGGRCMNEIGRYNCRCLERTTGRNCEIDQRFDCPVGFLPGLETGKCYIFKDKKRRRASGGAEKFCQRNGATLASLETTLEVNTVGQYLRREGSLYTVSAVRGADGQYRWNTGEILHSHDPSWDEHQDGRGGDCVAVLRQGGQTSMFEMDCNRKAFVVCETDPVL